MGHPNTFFTPGTNLFTRYRKQRRKVVRHCLALCCREEWTAAIRTNTLMQKKDRQASRTDRGLGKKAEADIKNGVDASG